ncbi:Transcriptional activator domain containing protein [Streptomyces sp. 769]|nr:Transcriptional activator domain containing protein [Streptomyces sp. 769]
MAIAGVAGAGAMTTVLVGLVTNAVSNQSHWPGWLGWIQRHPWLSFIVLGVATVGLAAWLATLSDSRTRERSTQRLSRAAPESGPPGAALVLRSLPRDIVAFTNRSAELEQLVGSVRASQDGGATRG